jgi:hypothetical protein
MNTYNDETNDVEENNFVLGGNYVIDVNPVVVFKNEDDLANWIQNNVMAIKDVEAYLAEKGHPIQHRAVYYAINYKRLKAWRTSSGTWLTLKQWVDQCWGLE